MVCLKKKIRTKVQKSVFLKKSVQKSVQKRIFKKIRTCMDKSVRVGTLLSRRFYTDKLAVLCKNVWRKNCRGAHGRSPIQQLYLILAVLLPTFTHLTAILHGQAGCSLQKHGEKKSKRSTWTQPNLAALFDPGCSTPNIYACYGNFIWTSWLFSANTWGEKIVAEHTDAAQFILMRFASFVESSAHTCGKNRNVQPQPKVDLIFPFQYVILFQTWQSLQPLALLLEEIETCVQ